MSFERFTVIYNSTAAVWCRVWLVTSVCKENRRHLTIYNMANILCLIPLSIYLHTAQLRCNVSIDRDCSSSRQRAVASTNRLECDLLAKSNRKYFLDHSHLHLTGWQLHISSGIYACIPVYKVCDKRGRYKLVSLFTQLVLRVLQLKCNLISTHS